MTSKNKRKIVVLGSDGQLGTCIKLYGQYLICDLEMSFLTRKDIDFMDVTTEDFERVLGEYSPEFIINCVAYTNTWQAEEDAKEKPISETDNWRINVNALKPLCEYCLKHDVHLIHISTDFVYSGDKVTRYKEKDTNGGYRTAYGWAKYEGEWIIRSTMENYTIFRTSWLMSPYGNNFLTKIHNKMNDGETDITMPYDEYANPTYASSLANFIIENILNGKMDMKSSRGVFNTTNVWNKPIWSKYDFAKYWFSDIINFIPVRRPESGRPQYVDMDMGATSNVFDTKPLETSINMCKMHYFKIVNKK